MKHSLLRHTLAITILTATVVVTAKVALAGNDFVWGELRVDLFDVAHALDYRVLLLANGKPNSGYPDYTTAWFGVYLAPYNGQPYSAQFTQVGLLTKSNGIRWFVYAEPGVTCLRGQPAWGNLGCEGNVNDLVQIGSWHWVELVTYNQGFWIARIYESNGTPHDVAKIWSTSITIYRAGSVTEEAYAISQDPHLTALFYHWHPQYLKGGVGWKEWPKSDGNNSFIYVTDLNGQNTFCPQYYGANPNYANDEHAWFAGMGGQKCSWLLSPAYHHYLPLVQK